MGCPGLGSRAECACMRVYTRVCTLTLLVGEEGLKGRRMGVAGVQPNLAAVNLGVSSLSRPALCSALGKGKCVCGGVGVRLLCVCVCF